MTGTIVATSVLVLLPEMLRFLSGYRMLVYAVVLIVMMLVTNNTSIKIFFAKLKRRQKGAGAHE